MEKERKLPEKAETMGEQYLVALIKCAEWVPQPYKKYAAAQKGDVEVLKEVYLCACDGVPIERMNEVKGHNPLEGALRFLRKKHTEKDYTEMYQEEVAGMKRMTSVLEREMKEMHAMLEHITEHVTNFDSMFPENVMENPETENTGKLGEKAGKETSNDEMIRNDEKGEEKDADALLKNIDIPEKADKRDIHFIRSHVPKFGTFFMKRKGSKEISTFVNQLFEKGYSEEQINYLMKCLEEGMTIKEIRSFASPMLPVELMHRLRILSCKKEEEM